MRIPTASILVLMLTAALAGCTDSSVDTDSLPNASIGVGASAVLAVDMDLPAETSYYMANEAATDAGIDASGHADAMLLVEGEASEELAAEAQVELKVGECAHWVTEAPITDDIGILADLVGQVYATAMGAPSAELTMSVDAVANGDVVAPIGSATTTVAAASQASATAGVPAAASDADPSAAQQIIYDIPAEGQVVAETTHILVSFCVDDQAGAMIRYGGQDAPAGIPAVEQEIQDTDGDGYGDSEERRHGSDEEVAQSTPATTGGNGGSGDPDEPTPTDPNSDPAAVDTDNPFGDSDQLPPEPVIAAFFVLVILALAGFTLLRRPTV